MLAVLGVVLLASLLLTAFAATSSPTSSSATIGTPSGYQSDLRPNPEIVAFESSLRLQMPIAQANVTAIGYHAGDGAALPLQPVGRQANQGFFSRLFHRIFGGGGGGLRYYMLSGGTGPSTGVLDVGALAGTDVYSPLDGTVVGISDFILNGTKYGSRIEIQPSGAPSILVDVTHLRPDPSLTVGSTLSAGTSKIGTVIDLSQVEGQALARYTRDAGNHVSMSVHEAATLAP